MSLWRQTGGYELTQVRVSEPLRTEFFLKQRTGGAVEYGRVGVTGSDPPRITGLYFIPLRSLDAPIIGYSIDAATRVRVIDEAIARLQQMYVYAEVSKQMAQALRRHQKHHDYDAVTEGDEFARLLTEHLREVSHDKHLRVRFSPARLPDNLIAGPDPQGQRRQHERNCGFDKVEILPGNAGYVKFDAFERIADCSATAVAAMGFLANSDALIFDLRENTGGDPGMGSLIISYLFAGQTHISDNFDRSTNTTRQSWSLPYVPGKRFPVAPVYVLTSSRTFSGAEEFSYDLQSLKRATIVGEPTGGGAHLIRPERLDDRFFVDMPFARAINPITKTDWEDTGVQPDVKVAATDALATAQKLAAEKLTAERLAGENSTAATAP
jgi:peptidase S41-like protein